MNNKMFIEIESRKDLDFLTKEEIANIIISSGFGIYSVDIKDKITELPELKNKKVIPVDIKFVKSEKIK